MTLVERARALVEPVDGTGPLAVWGIWINEMGRGAAERAMNRITEVLDLAEVDPEADPAELIRRVVQIHRQRPR